MVGVYMMNSTKHVLELVIASAVVHLGGMELLQRTNGKFP